MQQLKAKNHGLNTQMEALMVDHERLAELLSAAEKVPLLIPSRCRMLFAGSESVHSVRKRWGMSVAVAS